VVFFAHFSKNARQTTTMEDGAVRADWRAIDVVDDAWANDALPDDGASGPGTKSAGAREKRETTATRKRRRRLTRRTMDDGARSGAVERGDGGAGGRRGGGERCVEWGGRGARTTRARSRRTTDETTTTTVRFSRQRTAGREETKTRRGRI
jgi:hypothetical protein